MKQNMIRLLTEYWMCISEWKNTLERLITVTITMRSHCFYIPFGCHGNLHRRTRFTVFALTLPPNFKISAHKRTYVYCLNRRCSQRLIPITQLKSLARQSLKDLPCKFSSWAFSTGWLWDTYKTCIKYYMDIDFMGWT